MTRMRALRSALLLAGTIFLVGAATGAVAFAETYEEAVEGTSGVAHFWPMDESSGSTFADAVGGANAEASGGVTLGEPGGLIEDLSTSAAFDGSSGAAEANVDLSGTHEVTVEFWMKWHAYGADDRLALEFTPNFNSNPGGFLVDPDATPGSDFAVAIGNGGNYNNVLFERPSAEQWHYYAFVIDTEASGETEITPYVDGRAVSYTKAASDTITGTFADSTLYWMSRDAGALFGEGSMQDLALYDTALSSSAILEHYALGEHGPQAAFTSTPVAATAGVPVHFDASESKSPTGSVSDYAWDFDGSETYSTDEGSSPSTSHTFSSPGTYTVDLRVKDGLGQTGTVSRTVTVGAALGEYEQAVEGTSGISHFWPMGESSGSTLADVFSGADATTSGGVTPGETGGLVEDSSTAAAFDGSSGAAHASVDLSGTHELTVEFWMKWHAFAGDDRLALEFTPNFNDNPGGFLIDPDATPGSDFAVAVGQSYAGHNNNVLFERPSAEEWHYYAFVFDTEASGETQITPYVDGHAVSYTKGSSNTGEGPFADSTLYWMSRDANTLFGAGSMQDLALYDTTLSSGTILEHYALGEHGPKAAFTSAPVVATAGVPVHLDASGSSSPAGPISDYAWDFDGDKSYSSDEGSSATTAHTFSSPGTYTVDLRVKDSLGETATMSHTVTVGAALGAYEQAVEGTYGISHFWPMGESSGSTLADVFSGADATTSGGITLGETGGLVEDASTSVLFDGATGAAQAAVNLSNTHLLTVEFWMKWHAYGEDDRLALEFTPNFNSNPGGFLVDPDATPGSDFAVAVGQSSSGHNNNVLFERPSAEQWHYYAFVIDTEASGETEITPYVDGHAVSYTKLNEETGAGNFAGSTLYWMSRDASSLFGSGSMQDLAIYTTILSATTIAEHYAWGENTYRPVNTVSPSIEGVAQDEQTLSAHQGTWSGFEPISYAYQWERCDAAGTSCEAIPSATSPAYTIAHEDVGSTIRVAVIASNLHSSAEVVSEKSTVVAASPPESIEAPTITGTALSGETLRLEETWKGTPALTHTYQWQDCYGAGEECKDIAGATESRYMLRASDVELTVRAIITVTNSVGASSATVEANEVVRTLPPENEKSPTIAGNATVGRALVANPGEWSGDSLEAYSYQWEGCSPLGESCTPIVGATSRTYVLRPLDIGTVVRVTVTATIAGYASASSSSGFSGAVEPGPDFNLQSGSAGTGPGQFDEPAGIAMAGGHIWVLDAGNDRVERFSEAGEYEAEFGGEGSGEGQFTSPRAIAADSDGDVWILDNGNRRAEELSGEGTYIGQFKLEGSSNEGIAIANNGTIWISDTTFRRLEIFNTSGTLVETLGELGSGPGEMAAPAGIAIAPNGNIWVVDRVRDKVQEFNESFTHIYEFGREGEGAGEFESPFGIAVGPSNELWIGDEGNARLQDFDESGEYVSQLGTYGTGLGELEMGDPMGLAVGPHARWVTDTGNDRIDQWITPTVVPSNSSPPDVTGEDVDGRTLAAGTGEWSGAPTHYAYQWERCNTSGGECHDIAGAQREDYTLTEADTGMTVRAAVRAINASGSESAATTPTATVTAATAPSNVTAPTIVGPAWDGVTLNADPGTWSGTPGEDAYQWESCNAAGEECAPIEEATTFTYLLSEGDIGTTVRIAVTSTNAAGAARAVSVASADVAPKLPSELEAPTISGTPDEHHVLRADPGAWSGTERQFGYQWESCSATATECQPIEGATEPEYDLAEGDVSTTVRVRIGVNSALGAVTDASPATPEIGTAGTLASTTIPAVAGTDGVGQTLTVTPGGWANSASLSYSYQWQRCDRFGRSCADIESASGMSYVLVSGDAGHTVRVQVTASETGHSLSRYTRVTQPIAPAGSPTVRQAPLVEGPTLVGGVLTATGGSWSGEGSVGYAYQWERCTDAGECTSIEGATANSYTLAEGDVGFRLRVLVTATEGAGSSEGISAPSAAVDADALSKLSSPSIAGIVEAGGDLEADPGVWSGSGPVTYGYQWESCASGGGECTPIEEATEANFQLAEGAHGSALRVHVTVTGPSGSQSAYSSATVATPGGDVTVEQAEEAARAADPALLEPATGATLEGETIVPKLANEEELFSEHALTSASVAKENPGEFGVNTAEGELSLKPVESSSTAAVLPTLVNGTAALYTNLFPATDAIVRSEALGATTVLNLRSGEAPRSFSWEVGLGASQQLEQLSDGSVAVTGRPETGGEAETTAIEEPASLEVGEDTPESSAEHSELEKEEAESETEVPLESAPASPESSTTPGEAPVGEPEPQNTLARYEADKSAVSAAEAVVGTDVRMVVETPTVIDAEGDTVPASLSVRESTVTLTITPGEGVVYPLLAMMPVAAPTDNVSAERDPFEYGIAGEESKVFTHPEYARLQDKMGIKTARRTVPWDLLKGFETAERTKFGEWLVQAEAKGLTPYVTLKTDGKHTPPSVPAYRTAISNLIQKYGRKVKAWGAWNEPDQGANAVFATRAGQYWQAARSAAIEKGCSCTVVAGEFAQYETDSENETPHENRNYVARYLKGLKAYYAPAWKGKRHRWQKYGTPHVWGLHDYTDVVNDRTTNLAEFEQFARDHAKDPGVWVSEAGVELHDGVEGGEATRLVQEGDEPYEIEEQGKAAEWFLKLRAAKGSHQRSAKIERIYYYGFEAPSEERVAENANEFDSGLFEATPKGKGKSHGEERPAYCYLAYASHDCPPSVTTLSPGQGIGDKSQERAGVNPHGLPTTIEFLDDGGGKMEVVASKEIKAYRTFHPIVVGGAEFGPCGGVPYRAIVANAGGSAEGATWNELIPCL